MFIPERLALLRTGSVNLADARLGARAMEVSDEYFAPKERMLDPGEPVWREGVYDDNGKWMDGWETRRKRVPGHDWCTVRLAYPGRIRAFDVDTRYFTGNFPPQASLDGLNSVVDPDGTGPWRSLVGKSDLQGDGHNLFEVNDQAVWTHVRLNIFPDGGIARLRVFGQVWRDWSTVGDAEIVELSALENGGLAIACSDQHYGVMGNLLLPGAALDMGDGWETRRRRGPGNDWVVLRLGHPSRVVGVELDTTHFKGNFPHEASIDSLMLPDLAADQALPADTPWRALMPKQRLQMDQRRRFVAELQDCGPVSHLRVNIFPDGGLARVRVFGRLHRQ